MAQFQLCFCPSPFQALSAWTKPFVREGGMGTVFVLGIA